MDHVYLIAEDEPHAQLLLQRAFQRAGLDFPLYFTSNGKDTLDYLRGAGRYANRAEFPFPSILLLDYNMPRMNGLQVLRAIRAEPPLRKLIVVMLSSSVDESEILEAFEAGVNSYVEKPSEFGELIHVAICLNAYWFGCNHFPHATSGIVRPQKRHREVVPHRDIVPHRD
ncbi:MAG TPA: response regulator [Verrucomicrobiae bacterium]|jgi:two-component system response regulator